MPALVTPLRSDGSFDVESCRRLVAHVLSGGVHGVLALGSTGEVTSLDTAQRRRVLEVVAEAVGGRVPVLAGIAQNSVVAALAEAEAAASIGARAVLAVPPFYSPIDQATVLRFYRRLADLSPLPVLAYNIPAFTKVTVAPATVARLAEDEAIIGVKDSSRDMEYLSQVLLEVGERPGFSVFTGMDTLLLPSLAVGAAGAITLSANLVPSWAVRLYQSFQEGRWEEARLRQQDQLRLVQALRVGVFPSGIKAALAAAGICGEYTAEPVAPLSSPERERLIATLRALGAIPTAAA